MTQRYSALICALFASLMLSQMPAHANDLDDVKARGTLKVAVPQDFPPFGSVGPDMKPRVTASTASAALVLISGAVFRCTSRS